MALAVGIVVFLIGCALILAVSAVARGRRAVVALEQDFGGFDADAISATGDEFAPEEWPVQPDEPAKLRAS